MLLVLDFNGSCSESAKVPILNAMWSAELQLRLHFKEVRINSLIVFLWQRAEKLAGTVNWGTATVVGVFAGLMYGGSKEASASVVSMHPLLLDSYTMFTYLFSHGREGDF